MPSALIVDDEEDIRVLVRLTIESANAGLSVVGEAASGEEAVVRWREHRPEVVVLDHRMPGISGLETAALMLAEQPDQPIILFSAYLDDATRSEAEAIGIRACIAKTDFTSLPEALWRCVPPS